MRHKIFFLFILSLYAASSSPAIEFQHEQIQPGETILAKITIPSGFFPEAITSSQIKFFEGRKEVFLENSITLYNNTQYLTIYTSQEKNLTLEVQNILYNDGTLKSSTITRGLSIQNSFPENETYTQILRVRPGFIFSGNPKVKLTNMGTSTLEVEIGGETISLSPLASKEVALSPQEAFSPTSISSYKNFLIPTVYINLEENQTSTEENQTINETVNQTTNQTNETKQDLKVSSNLTLQEMIEKNTYEETMTLLNKGDNNLTNLKFTSSLSFITSSELVNMSPGEEKQIVIKLIPTYAGNFNETINISYLQNGSEKNLQIPLTFTVFPNGTTEENITEVSESCEDIGTICGSGETCNMDWKFTKNQRTGAAELCCPGTCIEKPSENKEESGYGWLVGLMILGILGYIGYYLYEKQKSLETPTSKSALEKTTESFQKLLSGRATNKTTGNLEKS